MTTYAGIGSRETPAPVLLWMEGYAAHVAGKGWHLRSGGAKGADRAFERGAYPAFTSFSANDPIPAAAFDWAEAFHPAWPRCSAYARRLHARNTLILLGAELSRPVDFVVCWTPDGGGGGGTGQALRIAHFLGIPVFDVATDCAPPS